MIFERDYRDGKFTNVDFIGFDTISDMKVFLSASTCGTLSFCYRYPYLEIIRYKVYLLDEPIDDYRIWLEYETKLKQEYCDKYFKGYPGPEAYLNAIIEEFCNKNNISNCEITIYDLLRSANDSFEKFNDIRDFEELLNNYKTHIIKNFSKLEGIGKKRLKNYTKFLDYFRKRVKMDQDINE